jgi:hypothetical protein
VAARRVAVSLAALWLTAAAAFAQPGVNPRIAPGRGHPGTAFRVGFTAPQAAGHQGVFERDYSVELAVGHGSRCTAAAGARVSEAAAGERVRVSISGPSPWCRGRGHGTVSMTEGPYCNRANPQPCPEFPTRTREIGRFSFRVVRR